MMAMSRATAALAGLVLSVTAAAAQDFHVENVASVTGQPVSGIAPHVVLFSDHTQDATPGAGLIPFEEWSRRDPAQQQLLNLYPGYTEPVTIRKIGRKTRTTKNKLTIYVATARFVVGRVPSLHDLDRYATLKFAEQLDPSITEQVIAPDKIMPLTNPKFAHNINPKRPWCVGIDGVCLRSHYQLEGKLPLGIRLANKLRDESKRIAEYLEFESELAVRAPDALDQAAVSKLTKLDTPVIGAIEQSTFYVNQILQFAKFVAVFQPAPSDAGKCVVTAFMTLAIETKVLDTKKEYAKVPVLRNLVPMQVLMGKSSFNTGHSISAGLPSYARSRIKTVAELFDHG